MGIFRYLFYSRVFSGIPGYFQEFLGILDIISFFGGSEPNIKVFSNIALDHEKLKSGCSCDDNNMIDNKVYKVWNGEIYIKWGRGADQQINKCDWLIEQLIVQPRGVPQSYLTLKWQILHFFAPFLWVPNIDMDSGQLSENLGNLQ